MGRIETALHSDSDSLMQGFSDEMIMDARAVVLFALGIAPEQFTPFASRFGVGVSVYIADCYGIVGHAAQKNLEIGRELVAPIMSERYADFISYIEGNLDGTSPKQQPLIEPLSPRELEVLRLVAAGCSNREISERLFLALSTVKGHNRNIFDKLQVQRRTEAVSRARELGLV